MKPNAVFLLLAPLFFVFSACATSRPSGDPSRRTLWVYPSGSFEQKTKTTWVEINPDIRRDVGQFKFAEVKRTPDYVYLYDSSRKLTVRLSDGKMEWRLNGEDDWKFLYTGSWKR